MDTIKCKALLWAVDTGSFSAAAAELGYTPSGINRMVNALEAELGFPLLARSRKGVTATSDGLRMLPILRELVQWGEQAEQLSSEIGGLISGEITIGTYYSVAAYWLPQIIKTFQADYPGIRIHTMEGGNRDQHLWLEEHRVDCCFLSEVPAHFEWIPLKEDDLMVWLPQDHPRAREAAFPLRELDGAPFINTLPGRDTDIERLFEQDQITPDVRFSTVDSYTTFAMVEAGLGLSINNRLMTQNWSGEVAVLPLDPPRRITLGIALPSLAQASPATQRFIAYAKRMIQAEDNKKDNG